MFAGAHAKACITKRGNVNIERDTHIQQGYKHIYKIHKLTVFYADSWPRMAIPD